MTENSTSALPISRYNLGGVFIGLGVVLIGIALLAIASQWQTYTSISLDSRLAPKAGFTWISETEKSSSEYIADTQYYYLLDRDTGRIWRRLGSKDVWEETYVEGITPDNSPATRRK